MRQCESQLPCFAWCAHKHVQLRKQASEWAQDAAFQRDYEDVLAGLQSCSGPGAEGGSISDLPSPGRQHIMAKTQSVVEQKAKIRATKKVCR
jgi:hypothetical protein